MRTEHPAWCSGLEAAGADHVSPTVAAADPQDLVGIHLRLSQPADLALDATLLTLVEVQFVEDGRAHAYPLPLSQVNRLADAIRSLASALTRLPSELGA
jgi:hypothetical protein